MAAPVLDNSNAWVEQFNSVFSITFNTTGSGKLLFLHVGAFFGDANLPTITGTTLTWTKLADTGDPSANYAGVYWAVTSGALTGEQATATFTTSCSVSLQVDEWSDATVYTGLTTGVDYGTATQQTDASVTTTPNVTVTTYAADSHVRGMIVGFIGEAWSAGTNTSLGANIADSAVLARSDNPQTSTGSYNIEAVNGSGNTDSWRGFSTVGYEVLGISGGSGTLVELTAASMGITGQDVALSKLATLTRAQQDFTANDLSLAQRLGLTRADMGTAAQDVQLSTRVEVTRPSFSFSTFDVNILNAIPNLITLVTTSFNMSAQSVTIKSLLTLTRASFNKVAQSVSLSSIVSLTASSFSFTALAQRFISTLTLTRATFSTTLNDIQLSLLVTLTAAQLSMVTRAITIIGNLPILAAVKRRLVLARKAIILKQRKY